MRHSALAYTGGKNRIVNHPSYQAYAYANHIKSYSEFVQEREIGIIPCAYLHNYEAGFSDQLEDPIYKDWYEEAPFFIKNDMLKIRRFIKQFVSKKSRDGNLLYTIDQGRIRPSKALQDCLVSVMKGNREFMLLDEQAVIFDLCKRAMRQCQEDMKKRTIIIQGGPGTGKSVLAVNLLREFITWGLNTCYCTKNKAPREVYLSLLSKSDFKAQANLKSLFRSPFGLHKMPPNAYSCMIVDEAHRLVEKMYGDRNGENQIKECIAASLLTVFFVDENQRISTKDIGNIREIQAWAKLEGSEVISSEDTVLNSQFRCNGSDQYIQLVNRMLQIGEEVDLNLEDLNFDLKIFDDPDQMRIALREKNAISNKARMVAGYCYDWDVKNRRGEYDIVLGDNFKAKWNLENDKIWAVNPGSFEEVGCIHTAVIFIVKI